MTQLVHSNNNNTAAAAAAVTRKHSKNMRKRIKSRKIVTATTILTIATAAALCLPSCLALSSNVKGGSSTVIKPQASMIVKAKQGKSNNRRSESSSSSVTSSSSSSVPPLDYQYEQYYNEDDPDSVMLDQVSALGLPSLRDASSVDVKVGSHHEENAKIEMELQQKAMQRRKVMDGHEDVKGTGPRRLMGKKALPTSRSESSIGKVRESLRVYSHEEEIELARSIQLGAKVNKLKIELEQERGRSISKTEWAKAAGFSSTSQLRRVVSDYRQAKNRLVMANMGLVHAVVKGNRFTTGEGRRIFGNAASYEELVQEGSLGLLRAAELFDPERGLRFSTYATIWIKGILSNMKVHEIITTPTRERTKLNKIRSATNTLKEMHMEATSDKISEMTGIAEDEVQNSLMRSSYASSPLSLDYSYVDSGSKGENRQVSLYGDVALMEHNDAAMQVEFQADVLTVLTRNLKPREADFIILRYGIKDGNALTLTQCAEKMGISYSRAQQLAKSCIKKLQKADEAKSLQEYFLTL